MRQFENKVAVITGGSSGIGKATALALANMGAAIVIASRNNTTGEQVVENIKATGGKAVFVKTDVSEEVQVKNLIEKTLKTFGRLDLAFNNAGIEQTPMPLPEQTEALYQQVMDINVKGVWLCLKHQIPAMLKSGGGSIVNTSSFSGIIAFATIPIYVASKHAVVGLTKAVALEYARNNIRVNVILPGSVENTGTFDRSFGDNQASIEWAKSIHPIGRLATPEEIANAVVFMLSDKSGFLTGHSMVVDGGYTAG
ncbi:MAG TPA: short chain dehydrogenase [Firmicutes bacterium]|nr:short chain dehydrogenase [Bacillota bacterium]